MARKRKAGDGTVRQRKDGRWEGRIVICYDDNGCPKTKNVLAKPKIRPTRQGIRKTPLKTAISEGFWSEWGGSNARSLDPKPMSEPSGSPVAPSLALSGTPAVPLWNSFALFVSAAAFVFWDLCGIEFCILKVLPTGFTSNSGCFAAESRSEIAPHKQRKKRDDKKTAG